MPTRSLQLKLIVPRHNHNRQLAQDIWTTHYVVNKAVAEVERVLLLCRGRGYIDADGRAVSAEEVQAEALAWARQVQSRNGRPNTGSDAEILELLRQLYEHLVPSVLLDDKGNPLEGSAQASRGWVGPLMSAESQGFMSAFTKVIDPLPAWVAQMQANEPGWEKASKEWLQTEEAKALMGRTGSPPAWIRRLKRGEPWQEHFLKDQQEQRRKASKESLLIRQLKEEMGLLPMLEPPVARQMSGRSGKLTPWDYLAVRLAVAHLLSWESWNHRAAREHAEIIKHLERQQRRLESWAEAVEAVRRYEAQRHEELKQVAQADDEHPFRISARGLRGWERVRERWRRADCQNEQDRIRVLAELQTRMRGRFGDPHLFRWLAKEEQKGIWKDQDPLPMIARCNSIQRQLQRKRPSAACTLADPQHHPRWVQFEATGSNLRRYRLESSGGSLRLNLPLLHLEGNTLVEQDHVVSLAPSEQFRVRELIVRDKRIDVCFDSGRQCFHAQLRSGDLLLSRRHLENRGATALGEGQIGPVWFKLVLDVQSQAPPSWLDQRGRITVPAELHHFRRASNKALPAGQILQPGLRVLSVDLGIRAFAACSVFELTDRRPERGMAFPIDGGTNLWARHERSFVLRLPGEKPSAQVLQQRDAARQELRRLRRGLSQLRGLLRLFIETSPQARRDTLASWRDAVADPDTPGLLTLDELDRLDSQVDLPDQAWQQALTDLHRELEKRLGQQVSAWRRQTRPRSRRAYEGGKSVWAIEYLQDVRRLLLSWTLHGRQSHQIRRLDREKGGIFAARLLRHINALKEDRIKTGADLLIQAARGYVAGQDGGWMKRFEPCRVILFEDLSRYRFRHDRPPWENSALMKWCHRRIVEETKMQAELYGLLVEDTAPSFSSRFHARSGAPGVRAGYVTDQDLTSPVRRARLEDDLAEAGVNVTNLRPGMLVPKKGGELFATISDVDEGAGVQILHADVNAAQNLQRRFWLRHADAYRLSAIRVQDGQGGEAWYPMPLGERLRGALAKLVGGRGTCRLRPAADGRGYQIEKVSQQQWQRMTGTQNDAPGEDDDETLEETLPVSRQRQTFFRDPSGMVLPADRWFPEREFWSQVHRQLAHRLIEKPMDVPF